MRKLSLRELLAKASPLRSGDILAGIAAESEEERTRAQMALADIPLTRFLSECVIPYEEDEVTRLIVDSHDEKAFAPVRSFTVGQFRDWLLTEEADADTLAALAPGITTGNGCRRKQTHARAGSGAGRLKMPGRHPLPGYAGTARTLLHQTSAEPSHRRCAGHTLHPPSTA